ncbi:hypothetical protein [Nostocoides sp. F2B08]|uniref:hypothetical protein n=1 Tax=Nostocoides sp. F2B08 TaxID=2653936 RepID=UPI001D040A75|nr:hypothetical protein [Tetrasphaera sp. F2B08]
MPRAAGRLRFVALALGAGLLLTACADPGALETSRPASSTPVHHGADSAASDGEGPTAEVAPAVAPLRDGERFVDVSLPVAYTPVAEPPGTDDYRCFVLDPGLARDSLVSGVDIKPGNPNVVHHVIVHKVDPDRVDEATALESAEPDPGYSCFGGSGLESAPGEGLDRATWVGAWAPGGGERVLGEDLGIPLAHGSRLVVQMHYSLLGGGGEDRSTVRLRVADDDGTRAELETMLLPAPVELPCRERNQGGLCVRHRAVADVVDRFGDVGRTGDRLHFLCGKAEPGPTQSCTREFHEPGTIRAVSGHMHLLGKSITIDVNAGTPDERRVLDIPVWDFDDQGAVPLDEPALVEPGDTITVTCTHDQGLRDLLPALQGVPDRYVVWGEGTTDEMCLGIVLLTRP